ncbi:hypothetical protein D3C72_2367430 [compost metagenome]
MEAPDQRIEPVQAVRGKSGQLHQMVKPADMNLLVPDDIAAFMFSKPCRQNNAGLQQAEHERSLRPAPLVDVSTFMPGPLQLPV